MEDAFVTIWNYIAEHGVDIILRVVAALVIFALGKWASGMLTKTVKRLMKKAKVDETLISFVGHLTYIGLMTFVVVAALNKLGIQTASFIAILGAAGLAVGFALQGSLSNFASGVMLIIFRPLQVGDLVEAGGAFGFVEEIRIFNTAVITPDNKTVIVPNSKITGDNIINYSTRGCVRLDLVFSVHYDDDIRKAKQILEEIMASDDRVLKDPAPFIGIGELGDNSVNFVFRPHVTIADYWGVYFDMHEKVKLRFDEEGITIPFPQRDVHIYNEK